MLPISLRLTPGAATNGATFTLTLEGLDPRSLVIGSVTAARVKVWELDARVPDTEEHEADLDQDDLLAEFSVSLATEPGATGPNLYFEQVTRVDAGPTELPKPQPRTLEHDGQRWTLNHQPSFVPPHFELAFESAGGGAAGDTHTILLAGDPGEREGYVFELGCTLEVEAGHKCYGSSVAQPAQLLCRDLIAANCVAAAELLPRDHQDMVQQRGVGTHHGSQYVAYLEARRDAGKLTQAELDQRLKEHEKDKADFGTGSTSCIVYVLDAIRRGHEESLAAGDWDRIMEIYRSKAKGSGVHLAQGLERAGWLGIFFCPDTNTPYADTSDYYPDDFRHVLRRARKGDHHQVLTVHDRVVDYAPTDRTASGKDVPPAKQTTKETAKLEWLFKVPIGVINLHGGMHTALYRGFPAKGEGYVYEVHWSASARNQSSAGNPYPVYDRTRLEDYVHWTSGIIHVPPGSWPPAGVVP